MNSLKQLLVTLPFLAFLGCADEAAEQPELNTLNCSLATYRILSADVPLSAPMAYDSALDLDADDIADNAGGGLLAFFYQQFGAADALPELVDQRLESDEAAWFIALNQCPDGRYLFWTLRGEDQNGDGIYELSSRDSPPAQGTMVDSTVQVNNGGFGEIPIGIFADPLGEASDIWSTGAGLAAAFTFEDGAVVGKLGIGLANDYFEIIGRPLAAFFTSRLQAGTSEFATSLDENADGIVSFAEFENSAFVRNTLLNPDLDLLRKNVYDPNRDGLDDSLSFGFSFRAEPAIVTWQ